MGWLDGVRLRLERGVRREVAEAEMEEEIRFHLEMEAERLAREEGLTAEEAWRRAVVAFGGVEGHKEAMRDGWGIRWWEALRRDVRVGARSLGRSPGRVAVAVLSLGLAIGLNTAMFSLADALLLKPLAVPAGERLVHVRVLKEGRPGNPSYPDYLEYRSGTRTLEGLAAYSLASALVRGERLAPARRSVQLVSEDFFAVLGLEPERGRFFLAEEDRTPGTHPVVVISHHYWRTEMGGDPGVVGDTLRLNGEPFTIVGVAPEGFVGVMPPQAFDLFVPMMMGGVLRGGAPLDLTRGAPFGWGRLIGRMAPGVGPAQAAAELSAIAAQLSRAYPDENAGGDVVEVLPVRGTMPELHAGMLPNIRFVMAMMGLVLLIACSNVAGLLLARAAARQHELAIRISLGAARGTLVRQLLVESLLLALPGGLLGFLLALRGAPLLQALVAAPEGSHVVVDFSLDGRILAFTTAAALGSGLLLGLLPAIRATRRNLALALRQVAPSGPERRRLGGAVVVVQVAFAAVLVLIAGVLARPVLRALWADPGFRAEGVLAVDVSWGGSGAGPEGGQRTFTELLRRLQARPEVAGVGTGSATLLGFAPEAPVSLAAEDAAVESPERRVAFNVVSTGLLELLGIPLLEGRPFDEHDGGGAPLVAVVNRSMARRLWPGVDPLGQRFRLGGALGDRAFEVVGVVADARYEAGRDMDAPYVFLPLAQNREQAGPPSIHLRARAGDPGDLIPLVRTEVRSLDPDAIVRAATLFDEQRDSLRPQRVFGSLFAFCAGVALLLAALGTYSLLSYTVLRRTREIGIRMALGAHTARVRRAVVHEGVALVLVGTLLGLPLGFLGARRIGQMFGGADAAEPFGFLVVALLFLGVAVLASWLPARRATRVDPMRSLRAE
jgi:predicted permease